MKEVKPNPDWIKQPCATCKQSYRVLSSESSWRNLCPACYKARKAAQRQVYDDDEDDAVQVVPPPASKYDRITKILDRIDWKIDDDLRELDYLTRKPKPIWRLAYVHPDAVRGFDHAQAELAAANRDLIALAQTDPVAAAARVRRLQQDARRLWWPQIRARLHPHRPRLRRYNEEN